MNQVEMAYCQSCDKQSSVMCTYEVKESSMIWVVIWLFLFFPIAILMYFDVQNKNKEAKKQGINRSLLSQKCKHCDKDSLIKVG